MQQLGKGRPPAAGHDIGGSLENQVPQQIGNGIQALAIRFQAPGVLRGELRDLGVSTPAAHRQVAAIVGRQKIRQLALHDTQPVSVEIQIPDHPRIQQRHGVGGHRVAKSRMKLFGHGGSPDDAASLEHRDFQSRGRKVGRADQAVVAAANDQGVAHWLQPRGGGKGWRLAGIRPRMRVAKLRRHTSFSPKGPAV